MIAQRDATVIARDAPSGDGSENRSGEKREREREAGGPLRSARQPLVVGLFAAERRDTRFAVFKPDRKFNARRVAIFRGATRKVGDIFAMTRVPRAVNCQSLLGNAFAIRDCRRGAPGGESVKEYSQIEGGEQ